MMKSLTKHILSVWIAEVIYHDTKSVEMYPIENEFYHDWWNSLPHDRQNDMIGKLPTKEVIDLSFLGLNHHLR